MSRTKLFRDRFFRDESRSLITEPSKRMKNQSGEAHLRDYIHLVHRMKKNCVYYIYYIVVYNHIN